MASSILERFLKYVKIDSASLYDQGQVPSTEKQRAFAKVLETELQGMGITQTHLSDAGCLYASIPANNDEAPAIGFSAHLDTTPEFSGHNVKPRIVKCYDGNDIVLDKENGLTLSPAAFPHLLKYIGQDIVVTDGNTLLGADDKAGIAEIISMCEYFQHNPQMAHGRIDLFFPSDEEIGCNGAKTLDKTLFAPDFAYTLDGGPIGEITHETFNASDARITIKGINIHPGLSKNQMKNAILIGNEFLSMIPSAESPSHTEGYEGYYHILEFCGEVELTKLRFYLRDHDATKLQQRKDNLRAAAEYLNRVYGDGTVEVNISDTYRNINDVLKDRPEIVKVVADAMIKNEIQPFTTPMRGGTDGTVLTFEGIPCPNICTGGHNFHGRYEYIPVRSIERITDVIIDVVKAFGNRKK